MTIATIRRTGLAVLVAAVAGMPEPAAAGNSAPVVPRFLEETGSSGVDAVFAGEWEYMVGGGVAAFDCDDDGRPDLLFAGGTNPAGLYRNSSRPGEGLAFEKFESGLEVDAVSGAYPLDIDSDRVMDVVLLRVGENLVMRGRGGCRFERANEAWGFDGGDAWSPAMAATWLRGETWPTIAIGNYIDRREDAFPWGSCTDNWLHRPAGPQGFAPPLPLTPSYCALSMLFTDWGRTGLADLRISNDREYYKGGQEQLWRIRAGDTPRLYTPQEGWKPLKIWGMGIAGHDLDRDGYPEYFLTSMADNKLQSLAAKPEQGGTPLPTYADIAFAKGVTAHRPHVGPVVKPSTAWHTQFADVNNDGLADLFVVKGNVDAMPDFAMEDPNNLLLQKPDGGFVEAAAEAGVASTGLGRGGLLVDLDLDGLLDMVVVNRRDKAQLWRNVSADAGNWLKIRPVQSGANPDAIGGRIEIRRGSEVESREIFVGGGHASGIADWAHVGLAAESGADIRVVWPDGREGSWHRLDAGGFYRLHHDGEVERRAIPEK